MSIITNKQGTLEYLTAEGIGVPHCFTTRYGGVSTGTQASLNLAFSRGDTMENVEKNIHILADAVGFDPKKLVMTRQTHSDIVRVVTEKDAAGLCHRNYPECDALVTGTPGVALMIFTADCTPLLLYDPVTGAVGAAHAGWRGTAKAIGTKTVEAMVRNFGCRPENICAADADVPEAMRDAFGDEAEAFIEKRGGKYHLDLKGINALALRRAGVSHIEISDACTYCQSSRFWSHRATNGQRGSQGAVIVCKEGTK